MALSRTPKSLLAPIHIYIYNKRIVISGDPRKYAKSSNAIVPNFSSEWYFTQIPYFFQSQNYRNLQIGNFWIISFFKEAKSNDYCLKHAVNVIFVDSVSETECKGPEIEEIIGPEVNTSGIAEINKLPSFEELIKVG